MVIDSTETVKPIESSGPDASRISGVKNCATRQPREAFFFVFFGVPLDENKGFSLLIGCIINVFNVLEKDLDRRIISLWPLWMKAKAVYSTGTTVDL